MEKGTSNESKGVSFPKIISSIFPIIWWLLSTIFWPFFAILREKMKE